MRRFGEPFARTFGSAMVHGIYAADSRILSVRAAFPTLWDAEEKGGGSIIRGLLRMNDRDEAAVDYVLEIW
jgi:oxygen-dependent protoporphyrinogen oxidase